MRLGDLEVARRERLRHALAAGGQVAADFAALRNARQAERHRLAADHQHALVALRDLRHEALHHDGGRAVVVERLDDGAQVQPVGPDAEDAHAAHAVQRLEDDLLVLGVEARDTSSASRVTSVGLANCANSMIASFSGWSRSEPGLLNTRAPSRSACSSRCVA